MTSPYLRIVPRTEQAARAGQKPEFAPSRLAEPDLPTERVRLDRRYRDLEASAPIPESWARLMVEGLIVVGIMAAVIWVW